MSGVDSIDKIIVFIHIKVYNKAIMEHTESAGQNLTISVGFSWKSVFGILVIGLAGAFFLYHTFNLHSQFLEFKWDGLAVGNFNHLLWNLAEGRGAVDARLSPLAAARVPLLLHALAPLYRIWPNPLFLPVIQTAALAVAAAGIFMLGLRYLTRLRALLLTLLYCFYPPIHAMSSASFNPAVLATPFVTGAILAAIDRKPLRLAICLFLSLACDLRTAALLLPLTIWAVARMSDRKWIAACVLTAACAVIGWVPFRADEAMGPIVFFGTLIAPYLFWGLAILEGWTDNQLKKRSILLAAVGPILFAGAVFASAAAGPFIMQKHSGVSHLPVRKSALNSMLDRIPRDAQVITTPLFMPRLANRSGVQLLTAAVAGNPSEADYALLDLEGAAAQEKVGSLEKFLKNGWYPIENIGSVVLVSKNPAETQKKLFGSVDLKNDRPFLILKAQARKAIELVGFTMDADQGDADVVRFSFYWRKLRNSRAPYTMSVDVVGVEGNRIYTAAKPLCYGLHPFPKWKIGEVVREEYAFVVPERLQNTAYEVRLSVNDERTGGVIEMKSSVRGAIDAEGRVRLIALDAI
jgi:hypothetical protein